MDRNAGKDLGRSEFEARRPLRASKLLRAAGALRVVHCRSFRVDALFE